MSEKGMTQALAVIEGEDIVFAPEWVARRDAAVAAAETITAVEDDRALDVAGAAQTQLTRLAKELEQARMGLTRPLDGLKRKIMDRAAEMARPITVQAERIRQMNSAYATRKAAEAKAEAERVERIRREQAAAAAAEREAWEAEANAQAREMFGEGAVAEAWQPPEPAAPAFNPEIVPRVTAPKTASNTFVEVWQFEVLDGEKVPREFCSVDERKIRAFLAYQKSLKRNVQDVAIQGVRVYAETSVRAR